MRPERAGEVDPDSAASAARDICLRLLTARPRTRAELAEKLGQRGITDECAGAVLDRFGEVGLIDDGAFAAAWVSSRHIGRGLAGGVLAAELRSRGIAPDVISAAVGQLQPETELATARQLVGRRLAAMRALPAEVRCRRLIGMLGRKGYPVSVAAGVVRDALAASVGERDLAAIEGLSDR